MKDYRKVFTGFSGAEMHLIQLNDICCRLAGVSWEDDGSGKLSVAQHYIKTDPKFPLMVRIVYLDENGDMHIRTVNGVRLRDSLDPDYFEFDYICETHNVYKHVEERRD